MRNQVSKLTLGIDIGSTTAKAVLARIGKGAVEVVSAAYVRHDANLVEAMRTVIDKTTQDVGTAPLFVTLTGSVGMGLAERTTLPFVQEVQASATYAAYRYPNARALLDIGGEDSKLVFFEPDGRIDARMNGGCAGGTGAFLDQMAAVLPVEVRELERLAADGRQVHPIAMRCGVFAKTDVQNLLSAGVPKEDVALSVFHAVANQVISTLGRGRRPTDGVLMTGGPLTFLPTLRRVFGEKLGLASGSLLTPAEGALATAEGAALALPPEAVALQLQEIVRRVSDAARPDILSAGDPPLFVNSEDYESWSAGRLTPAPRVSPAEAGDELFLGIDSGSTTTKVAIIDRTGRLVATHYQMNHGDPLGAARTALAKLQETFGPEGHPVIHVAAVTGYGEDLVRAGFGIDLGLVETEAHLRAARTLASDVSFVLDIGGQDMKALFSFGCGPDAIVVDEAASLLESRGKSHMALRVDESTAPGSIRLRLRTLEMNARAAVGCTSSARRSTKPYTKEDQHRTLITAPMDSLLFAALAAEMERLGYQVEVAPPTDPQSLDLGLKYVNNEICYPAILTIGDILKSLGSGRHRLSEVAVLLTQTGGQCRASNYVPLLKKAMVSAGFGDVPVVSVRLGMGEALNDQPGFAYNGLDIVKLGLQTVAVIDALTMMVHTLAPRESNRGSAQALAEDLAREWAAQERRGLGAAIDFVEYAARKMSAVPVARQPIMRVGIVGEIYAKYSSYANHNLIAWLVDQGVEPVVPPLMSFLTQGPLNVVANHDALLDPRMLFSAGAGIVDYGVGRFLRALNDRLEQFPYPIHFPIPRELAQKAAQVIALTHQYGEGWGIAGEILNMADHGVRKVVCLQPFGCISNQVIARGVERRLRAIHPDLQLLYLDLDHNTSDANMFNRLRLLISPPVRISEVAARTPSWTTLIERGSDS